MKVIIVALALVALAAAAPADVKEPLKILRAEFDSQPDGAFVSRTDGRWSRRVLECSRVGRPPARYSDDLRKIAGGGWMSMAKCQDIPREMGKS